VPAKLLRTREDLEARLQRPEAGENGHRDGAEELSRIEALAGLKALADRGEVPPPPRRGGVNTHVHTAKSFSAFASPAEAAWQAFREGLSVLGINDHYTLRGHDEFRAACEVLGIRAVFSMESVAVWEKAEQRGETVNDPDNPGRTYLSAKAVTRALGPRTQGRRDLETMNRALFARHRAMTEKLSALIAERLGVAGALRFEDVLALTPHGQPTERHVADALARWLEWTFGSGSELPAAVTRLSGEAPPPGCRLDLAALGGFLRARLLKAGRPAYVAESREAYVPIERMVGLALDLGAIPTYPVLGDPVTPWEEDIERLYDRLEGLGIHAVEVIPDRNRRERLREIVAGAAARSFPVFNGTEHNTRSRRPMVDRFFFDPEFRPHFELGARVLLGHQALRARGEEGYVREDGSLPSADRRRHLLAMAEASGMKFDGGNREGP
jgi:hypothetical protein